MRYLDLGDLVALAMEVSEIEVHKLVELLDDPEVEALLADAGALLAPHEAAAGMIGLMASVHCPRATGGSPCWLPSTCWRSTGSTSPWSHRSCGG